MAWLDSFTYQASQERCECSEGDHLVCCKEVKEERSQNNNAMLVFYCNVKDDNWNGVQLRLYAMEGAYFDNQLSRLCDCFGVPYTQATTLSSWKDKIGTVRFDHWKWNKDTKKNETVPELQNHIQPKKGFKQPDVAELPGSNVKQELPNDDKIPF